MGRLHSRYMYIVQCTCWPPNLQICYLPILRFFYLPILKFFLPPNPKIFLPPNPKIFLPPNPKIFLPLYPEQRAELSYIMAKWSSSASGSLREMPDSNVGPLSAPEVWCATNEPPHLQTFRVRNKPILHKQVQHTNKTKHDQNMSCIYTMEEHLTTHFFHLT